MFLIVKKYTAYRLLRGKCVTPSVCAPNPRGKRNKLYNVKEKNTSQLWFYKYRRCNRCQWILTMYQLSAKVSRFLFVTPYFLIFLNRTWHTLNGELLIYPFVKLYHYLELKASCFCVFSTSEFAEFLRFTLLVFSFLTIT